MEIAEFLLLAEDAYQAFGQKPPAARTLERLWDRETQLLAGFPSSRLDDALQTLTRDETRSRLTPRDIINTLRTLSRHTAQTTDRHVCDHDGNPDPTAHAEWEALRAAKAEAARTGEAWHDILTRNRHNPDPPSTEAAQWIADIRDYLARKLALNDGDPACP